MNYYLLFGLTFLMCLVVTVIYMPKYNFKEVLICMLVWTIIATMGTASFILAFPKEKPVVTKVIDTITSAQQAEVKPEDVEIPIDTSSGDARVFYDKFDQAYNNNNATSAQKQSILDDFSFRKVRWTGAVDDVEDEMTFGYWSINVDIGNDDRFIARIENPSREIKNKLLSLKKGEEITIEGTTELMLWSWKLSNAKIIEE